MGISPLGFVIWWITQTIYDKKASTLKDKQKQIDTQLKQYVQPQFDYELTVSYILDLASRASELFESSKPEQKRKLINYSLTNLALEGETLHYDYKKPFDAIAKGSQCSCWLPLLDTFRTPEYYDSISNIGQQLTLIQELLAS